MSVFAKTSSSPKPKTKNVSQVSLLLAGIFILFVMTQICTLGPFTRLIESFWLPGGVRGAHLLTALIVITELFAVPFLVRMRLSKAMRILSMICGWAVVLIWLGLSLWLVLSVNAIHNIGFLGTIFDLQPGWWAILFSTALGILSVWASWGMWPLRGKK